MDFRDKFLDTGWLRFPADDALLAWVNSALPVARAVVKDPRHQHWLRCGGTWFAGVNVLGNDRNGAVAGGPNLGGSAIDFLHDHMGHKQIDWDSAQVSVCYPGYPRPMDGESDAAFRFRRDRDAAHIDGLLPEGERRRRHLREHHAFVLGIPLSRTSGGASALVVWEGSHEVVRTALRSAFAGVPARHWGDVDITNTYQSVRRRIFDECRRVEIRAQPGEAYILHRLSLHGVSRWCDDAVAGSDGRMIAYFRPDLNDAGAWLDAP